MVGPEVQFTVEPGAYNYDLNVQISCEDVDGVGCDLIYYTLDGSEPNKNSEVYSGDLLIEESSTVKAVAYDLFGNSSEVSEVAYEIDKTKPVVDSNLSAGYVQSGTEVTLTCIKPDLTNCAEIYFTLNGSVPDQNSTRFQNSIVLTESSNLKAIGYDSVGNFSSVLELSYIIDSIPPELELSLQNNSSESTEVSEVYRQPQQVEINCTDESSCSIYYDFSPQTVIAGSLYEFTTDN